MDIAINTLAVLIPLPLTYAIFFRAHLSHVRHLHLLEYFFWGAALAGVTLPVALLTAQLIPGNHPFVIGFLRAALPEKLGAFLMLFFFVKRRKGAVVIQEVTMGAMTIGLGFAGVENFLYALSEQPRIVIPRSLSSVPLHVTTCGLMGYLLALAECRSVPARKWLDLALAALFPYALHGLFDSLLYSGGRIVYLIGAMLVGLVLVLDYVLARSQTLPPLEMLREMSLNYEEWETIQREPQYERWILQSMGSRNTKYVPLLRWEMDPLRTFLVSLLLFVALGFVGFQQELSALMALGLHAHEELTLFSVLPAAYAFALVGGGAMNPQYFRSSLIRIPIIADVDFTRGGDEFNAITYDVSSSDCLLKTVDDFSPGTELTLTFLISSFTSPPVRGRVVWDNHVDEGHPSGTVVRFTSIPEGFRGFLLRYYIFRFVRGLVFTLRVPGFELIRRLFVRPTSVMQEQQRFAAGTVLFREGDLGREFYLVQKGEVEFFKEIAPGERVSMAVCGPGEVFGEMAVVGDQPRAATAVCKTDCALAVADGANLEALIQNSPEFAGKLIRVLSQRLTSSESILTRSITALEDSLLQRERFFRTSLVALLLSIGIESEDGAMEIPADPERAARALDLPPRAIERMIGWLRAPDARTVDDFKGLRLRLPELHFLTDAEDSGPRPAGDATPETAEEE